MVVAQWKNWFLKYHMTLSPSVQLPNHTQLTSKCITKMLLEVSHYLGCDFSFGTGKCAHARWCAPLEPWAAISISIEERMGSVNLDRNRPWHSNLTQHSQGQHGDIQAGRHRPGRDLPSWSEHQRLDNHQQRVTTLLYRLFFLSLPKQILTQARTNTLNLHTELVFQEVTSEDSIRFQWWSPGHRYRVSLYVRDSENWIFFWNCVGIRRRY